MESQHQSLQPARSTISLPDHTIRFRQRSVISDYLCDYDGYRFITSALTSKVKQNALEAQEKEAEASALFQLTNRLTDAIDISDIASITTDTISSIMNCRAACLCFDESGQPEQSFIQQQSAGKQVRRKVDDTSEINTE
jgi:K+-sensing histidine kinase KdpD